MCGIVGLIDHGHQLDDRALGTLVVRMRDRLTHRGPDDAGLLLEPRLRLAMGHRRLSIVDLTDAGAQPMTSACGRYSIVYNGEIYNTDELRAGLPHVRWRGHSDTEALLEHLARRGPEGVADLNGMFAFALLDRQRDELILARDRFGQKPLYYTCGDHWFAYASELSALRAIPWFDASIDSAALATYLLLQYVHQPMSIHPGTLKLPPGCWMRVQLGLQPRAGQPQRYFDWSPDDGAERLDGVRDVASLLDELDALLTRAVRRRLVSDVPLGVLLSGGVDSALIASAMRRCIDGPVRSFSIGFDESAESEHEEARHAAAQLGTIHTDDVLKPDVLDLLPTVVERLDEPLGDSSCLPTWLLARLARRDVKVVLSGDGGDELFGGYQRYAETLREQANLAHRLRYVASRRQRWNPADAYCSPRFWMFMPEQIGAWMGVMPLTALDVANAMREEMSGAAPLVHRMRGLDVHTYLPGAVLAKVDRMTMAHGLEARSPFLDPDVAAFAARLPSRLAGTAQRLKPMLRDLLARRLPAEWAQRPKKGFGLPSASWSQSSMIDLCDELLLAGDGRCRGLLDCRALSGWVNAQRRPESFSVYQVWTMLVLELWLRRLDDQPAPPSVQTVTLAQPVSR